ncbi:Secreted protein (modular protein) [Candidatus Terasakiella magnetica]|nr:Secreted protein (modular protein) [Candidatus Terasakiella magnetica]
MLRRTLLFGLAGSLAAALAACGRKGFPEQPEGSVYPRRYPDIQPPENSRRPAAPPPGDPDFQPPQPRQPARPDELKLPPSETGR